jgi:hypothetical protein
LLAQPVSQFWKASTCYPLENKGPQTRAIRHAAAVTGIKAQQTGGQAVFSLFNSDPDF